MDLRSRVSNADIMLNFKQLQNLLVTKFETVEDVRVMAKNMLIYQEYVYPLQLQTLVSSNFEHISSQLDVRLIEHQRQLFEQAFTKFERATAQAQPGFDAELTQQIALLEREYLRGGWLLEPLQNPEFDFVSPLVTEMVS